MSFSEIKRWAAANDIQTEILLGFHIVPFVLPVLHPVLDYFDRFGRTLGSVMLNIGFRGAIVLGQR